MLHSLDKKKKELQNKTLNKVKLVIQKIELINKNAIWMLQKCEGDIKNCKLCDKFNCP